MEVKFDIGYGSNAKTVKVEHGYRCVKFTITGGTYGKFPNEDSGDDPIKIELPTDQLLAIVKCFRTLEQNNS